MKSQTIRPDDTFILALATTMKTCVNPSNGSSEENNSRLILSEDLTALAGAVNACFWTSVARDEGRPITGVICFTPPSATFDSRELTLHLPLTVEHLKKMMIASPASSVGVHIPDRDPVIWGLVDAPPQNAVEIRMAAPGRLIASVNQELVAVMEGEERFIPTRPDRWQFHAIVGKAVSGTHPFPNYLQVAARFRSIVQAICQQGHGGALLIVPDATSSCLRDLQFAYELTVEASQFVRRRIDEFESVAQTSHEAPFQSAYAASMRQTHLDRLLRSIGHLSAVDGAVVMDERLNVLGFGAKLSAVESVSKVLEYDPIKTTHAATDITSQGGMRHQSAARFVAKHKTSMIFVASQDGSLTLYAGLQDENQVVAIKSLQYLI